MNIVFNAERHFLGKLCLRSHEWENSGQSLRLKSSSQCAICHNECGRRYRNNKPKEKYLGKLCQRKHNWQETEQSLRYSGGQCVKCVIEKSRAYEAANRERVNEQHRLWNKNNPERSREIKRLYRERNREKLRQKNRIYQKNNPEVRKATFKSYYERNKEKCYRAVKRRKVKRLGCHVSLYSKSELNAHLNSFGGKCAYCGCQAELTSDHFIPISKGGSDCLGNIVPACKSCNSSKNCSDAEAWYKSQDFYSARRWKAIIGKVRSINGQIPLF